MDLPTTHYDIPSQNIKETSQIRPTKSAIISRLVNFPSYLLLALVFLLPLVFIPSPYAPIEVVKSVVMSVGILLIAIVTVAAAFGGKNISIPTNALGYTSIAVILSTIISALLSLQVSKSFFGQGFEVTTASFVILMFLVSYLVSRLVLKDYEMILKVYSVLFVSFVILALVHIARFIGGADFMTFNILSSVTSSLAGKWYDFAILSGLVSILSFVGIRFLPLRTSMKVLLWISLVVSAAFLFIANSSFIWLLIALMVLSIGIYELLSSVVGGQGVRGIIKKVPVLTLILFIISAGLAWKGDTVAIPVIKKINAEYGEVVLPWQLTLDIASETIKESPLWGAGPNRFSYQYNRFKPAEINLSPFWNTEFSAGFGLIPTYISMQGLVGVVAWGLFLIFFAIYGFRALRRVTDPLKKFSAVSSFFAASFLWLVCLVYIPSHTIIFLTFVFSGIFGALLVAEGLLAERMISLDKLRFSQSAKIASSIALIVLIAWLGVYVKKTIAITYFQKGIKDLNIARSPDAATKKFQKALLWDTSDIHLQALSEVNIIKINMITQELQARATQNPGAPIDQKKVDQVVSLISDSVALTKKAQAYDPNNFYNHLSEARISEIGASLKIPNAYQNAKNAYARALETNPYNPALYLNLARLEASENNVAGAEQSIGRALSLKQNYTDAVFFLSQLQVAQGKTREAIVSTQFAIQLTPQEPLLYFQLGLLYYNDKNYGDAITSFEKAVKLNGQYANARYFLGLSYARMGRNADAIAQFEELGKTNPDNKEVAFILGNLREGKSPFADAKPPIDSKPEKRKTLPVTEKSVKKSN